MYVDKDIDVEKQESEKKGERLTNIKSHPPQDIFGKNPVKWPEQGQAKWTVLVGEILAFSPSYHFLQKDACR